MKNLLPHQIADADFLASKSFAGNFSGMGSGKTLSAIAAMQKVHPLVNTQTGITSINIIIAPPIALGMWASELAEASFRPCILRTSKKKPDASANVLLMSYDIATKRAAEFDNVNVLICDESHALKSVKAKRTKAILGKGGLCERAAHSWMLTGTPVTRWNDDLFPFLCRAGFDTLKADIGGMSMEKFQLKYCITQKRTFPGARFPTKMVVGSRNTDQLNEMIFDGMAVRHELADVWKNMPPITHNRLNIELSKSSELKEVLDFLDNTAMRDIEEAMRKQDESISSARRIIGLAKVDAAAAEIIDRVQSGNQPILVGAWHRQVIDGLVEAISDAGISVSSLDGRTSAKEKDRLTREFNDKQLSVLVGQISAMGVSLNLQRGSSHIIVVEEDWSPSIMDQFYARLHRMGQQHGVHVDTFIAETKLDRAVERINKAKRQHHGTLLETDNDN